MMSQTGLVRDAAIGVAVTDHVEGLAVLKKPGCAAALWRRQIPADIHEWLARLAPEVLPHGRIILRPENVKAVVLHLCEFADTPDCAERDWLVRDVSALVGHFATLMDTALLRLRLDVVRNNACRKFHIDALPARLICTYRGQGTQYGISSDGADPKRVFQVATGAPILLRGTEWPEDPPSGLLHRSPPIEGTGETRLLLVVDPVADPEDAA